MASSVTDTVSIDRSYLDTLIRRLPKQSDGDLPSPRPTVTVSRIEYDILLETARKFANLRGNLMKGGVTEDTLEVSRCLHGIQWQENAQHHATPPSEKVRDSSRPSEPYPRQPSSGTECYSQSGQHLRKTTPPPSTNQDWAETGAHEISDPNCSPVGHNHHPDLDHEEARVVLRPQYERMATRTVLIANLAEGTTHADITAVVRGGQLLDIYLRSHDRSAQVSFLCGADARKFFDYARRYDLYIKHKRVDIRWSDRQFTLTGYIANKVAKGATRNLVIRRCDHNVTEKVVRDDLEHIHNLVITQVRFEGGSCYISTNSVNNALFARTCMMSRAKYKGSKIDWGIDECAQPLEEQRVRPSSTQGHPQKHAMNPMANRFELLNLDGEDDDGTASDTHPRSSLDVGP
ncbi:hypothetical protein CMUS01_02877 [Colletotrichum musicola]|uniref:Negative regulator of differentiation 1 n=1 Tax=Colletotrichum musicola TaxID=2175873 RepID=A0A8H6U7F0_9PEZI|nr:hypothetical protein CMUS01_02877 [Colletotrichum musicola]